MHSQPVSPMKSMGKYKTEDEAKKAMAGMKARLVAFASLRKSDGDGLFLRLTSFHLGFDV